MMRRATVVVVALFVGLALLGAGGTSRAGRPEPPVPAAGRAVGPPTVQATVRNGFTYQGRLADSEGNPVEGQVDMVFQFWDAEEGGDQLGDDVVMSGVEVEDGAFDVVIDAPPGLFDGRPLWLRVKVGAEWLAPRQEIAPVPYALGLRPGAEMVGSEPVDSSIVTAVNVGQGHGLVGSTESDDDGYRAAGVYGVSHFTRTFGVLAQSEWGIAAEGYIGNVENPSPAVVGLHQGPGTGVLGISVEGIGVWGATEGDTAYQDAGVRGHSVHTDTYGVLGESDWGIPIHGRGYNPDSTAPAIFGHHAGLGSGIEGYSALGEGVRGASDAHHGVHGETSVESAWEHAGVYGTSFHTTTYGVLGESLHGVGVAGRINNLDNALAGVVGQHFGAGAGVVGQGDSGPGVVGTSASGLGGYFASSSDLALLAEGDVEVQGDLSVTGALNVGGPTCVVFDDLTVDGTTVVGVPDFCVDQICQILLWTDATLGAFGPGLIWPVSYTQSGADGSWIGGPNIAIAGVSFSGGAGVNGDGNTDPVFIGGQTVSGAYVTLDDDDLVASSPETWVIDFQTDAELTDARYYVCPMGVPVGP